MNSRATFEATQIAGRRLVCNTICQEPMSARLFNYLVSAREQHHRHLDAEHPSRLQVDDELEFGRSRYSNLDVFELLTLQRCGVRPWGRTD